MRTGHLFTIFILIVLNYIQAFRVVEKMRWKHDPQAVWDRSNEFDQRHVLFILNMGNYNKNKLEKTYVASGLLIDYSRILTSYTPFKKLIYNKKYTDKLLVLLVTNGTESKVKAKVANLVCGRQLIPDVLDEPIWQNSEHSPLHDLMVFRMDEEIGTGINSGLIDGLPDFSKDDPYAWEGPGKAGFNALLTVPARSGDEIRPDDLRICSLGYRTIDEMKSNDKFISTVFGVGEDIIVDCEEWFPKEWGMFICLRNIEDFTGVGSGASLFSDGKLFGLGGFAMFRNDTGILVFTDVRPYDELIDNTCGEEEIPHK